MNGPAKIADGAIAVVFPGLVVGELTIVARCEDQLTGRGEVRKRWAAQCLCGRMVKRQEYSITYAIRHDRNMACTLCRNETLRGICRSKDDSYRKRTALRLSRLWAEYGVLYSAREIDRMIEDVRASVGEYLGLKIEEDTSIPVVDSTWKETKRAIQKDDLDDFRRSANEAFGVAAQHTFDVSEAARMEAKRQYDKACGRPA